jgi:hypothetical protein
MDPADPGNPELLSDVDETTSTHSARETTAQDDGGSKKQKKGGKGGASRSSPARVIRPKKYIETQSGGFYSHPFLLGVLCACACPNGSVVAR